MDISPIVNKFGQTIYPGDKVIFITSGYSHREYYRIGKFLGTKNSKYIIESDSFNIHKLNLKRIFKFVP